jgi:hypothetical protein
MPKEFLDASLPTTKSLQNNLVAMILCPWKSSTGRKVATNL